MIEIKETNIKDIDNVQRLWADGDVMRFVGFPNGLHQTSEEMKGWFRESFYEIDEEHQSAALDIKLFGFARGRGIATAGLSFAIKEAFRNGAEIVWVDPNPENTKAIALYKRLGFQQKAFPAYLISEDKEQNSIYMELCKD